MWSVQKTGKAVQPESEGDLWDWQVEIVTTVVFRPIVHALHILFI